MQRYTVRDVRSRLEAFNKRTGHESYIKVHRPGGGVAYYTMSDPEGRQEFSASGARDAYDRLNAYIAGYEARGREEGLL